MVVAVQAEPRKLLLDVGSTARELLEADFRDWMVSQRVFISSVMDELREEQRVVAERVGSLGGQPVWFETFGGMDDDPEAAYLNEVASSSIYVGILGRLYGKLLPSRYSATHAEYLAAEERGLGTNRPRGRRGWRRPASEGAPWPPWPAAAARTGTGTAPRRSR